MSSGAKAPLRVVEPAEGERLPWAARVRLMDLYTELDGVGILLSQDQDDLLNTKVSEPDGEHDLSQLHAALARWVLRIRDDIGKLEAARFAAEGGS